MGGPPGPPRLGYLTKRRTHGTEFRAAAKGWIGDVGADFRPTIPLGFGPLPGDHPIDLLRHES